MSAQRELKADRMVSIDKCQAKGGPLNCRYHSGIINDCMTAIINKTAFTSMSEHENLTKELENNILRLLQIYKPDTKKNFQLPNNKELDQHDIQTIHNNLKNMLEALHNGHSKGKTLPSYVDEFNELISIPTDRITPIDYEKSIPSILQHNKTIIDNLLELPEEINLDGSFREDWFLSDYSDKERYKLATEFYLLFANKAKEIGNKSYAYEQLNKELSKLYPPAENKSLRHNPYALENRMSKSDLKEFWEYITSKYPILEQEYETRMHQSKPETIKELESFKNTLTYQISNLQIWENNLYKIMEKTEDFSPLSKYLSYQLIQNQNQTETQDNNDDYTTDYDNDYITTNQNPRINKLVKTVFQDVLDGKNIKTVTQLLKETDYINANWDVYNITNTLTNPTTGNTISKDFDIDYNNIKRKINTNGNLQYDIPTHTDRYADMSDDSRYWGTDKIETLSIIFDKNGDYTIQVPHTIKPIPTDTNPPF